MRSAERMAPTLLIVVVVCAALVATMNLVRFGPQIVLKGTFVSECPAGLHGVCASVPSATLTRRIVHLDGAVPTSLAAVSGGRHVSLRSDGSLPQQIVTQGRLVGIFNDALSSDVYAVVDVKGIIAADARISLSWAEKKSIAAWVWRW